MIHGRLFDLQGQPVGAPSSRCFLSGHTARVDLERPLIRRSSKTVWGAWPAGRYWRRRAVLPCGALVERSGLHFTVDDPRFAVESVVIETEGVVVRGTRVVPMIDAGATLQSKPMTLPHPCSGSDRSSHGC